MRMYAWDGIRKSTTFPSPSQTNLQTERVSWQAFCEGIGLGRDYLQGHFINVLFSRFRGILLRGHFVRGHFLWGLFDLEGAFGMGGILNGGICPRGLIVGELCPGGFCPGAFCRRLLTGYQFILYFSKQKFSWQFFHL